MSLQLLSKVYGKAGITADGPTLSAAGPSVSATTVKLPFADAGTLTLANVSHATVGCQQSPFELGWANGSCALH